MCTWGYWQPLFRVERGKASVSSSTGRWVPASDGRAGRQPPLQATVRRGHRALDVGSREVWGGSQTSDSTQGHSRGGEVPVEKGLSEANEVAVPAH